MLYFHVSITRKGWNRLPNTTAGNSAWTWSGCSKSARAFLVYVRRLGDHPMKLRFVHSIAEYWFRGMLPVIAPSGARLLVDPEDWIGRQIAFHGAYEPRTLALAIHLLRNGGLVVDVGACFGLYTCTLGVLPSVRCVAIEPAAQAFVSLSRNVALNPSVRAALYHVAVNSNVDLVPFSQPDPANQGKTRIAVAHEAAAYYASTVRLSDIFAREVQGEQVTLLKIDVEGMELAVLRGVDWTPPMKPQNIIIEVNECIQRAGESAATVQSFLAEKGYEALTVEGDPYDPLIEPTESNIWFRGSGVIQ